MQTSLLNTSGKPMMANTLAWLSSWGFSAASRSAASINTCTHMACTGCLAVGDDTKARGIGSFQW